MPQLNEAETRAEHIDPALKAAGWGEVEGSRVHRESRSRRAGSRAAASGRRAKIADYVLDLPQHEAGGDRGQAVGPRRTPKASAQAKDYASKLRRPLRLLHQRPRHLRDRHGRRAPKGDVADVPDARRAVGPRPSPSENAWRDRFAAIPFETRAAAWGRPLLPGHRHRRACSRRSPPGKQAHPADAGDRHRQDRHRVPDRLEAVPEPLEPDAASRPASPRILFLADRNILADQAYNAFSALPRRRPRPHRPRRHPQEGQGAEERQHLLHHLPDLHERAMARQPSPYFGEYPPDFFDFIVIDECHRGGAQRREHLARHPRVLRAGRAARPDRHAEAQATTSTPTPTSASRSTSTRSRTASTTAS